MGRANALLGDRRLAVRFDRAGQEKEEGHRGSAGGASMHPGSHPLRNHHQPARTGGTGGFLGRTDVRGTPPVRPSNTLAAVLALPSANANHAS